MVAVLRSDVDCGPKKAGDADAYAVLGLAGGRATGAGLVALRESAARLDQAWRAGCRGAAWPWFRDRLGEGAGARLPQAMIMAGRRLDDPRMVHSGLLSLDWYGRRAGLGNGPGLLRLPTPAAEYASDAGALIEAFVTAYRVTAAPHHARLALTAFAWFHGGNRYGSAVYDPQLGVAARLLTPAEPDAGDQPDGTLAYLGALLSLADAGLVRIPVDLVGDQARDLAPA
jgi:hypothetical protein